MGLQVCAASPFHGGSTLGAKGWGGGGVGGEGPAVRMQHLRLGYAERVGAEVRPTKSIVSVLWEGCKARKLGSGAACLFVENVHPLMGATQKG